MYRFMISVACFGTMAFHSSAEPKRYDGSPLLPTEFRLWSELVKLPRPGKEVNEDALWFAEGERPQTGKRIWGRRLDESLKPYAGVVTVVSDRLLVVDGQQFAGFPRAVARFIPSVPLMAGRPVEYLHTWGEVQVGDKVTLLYDRIDSVNVCTSIAIRRRPGGRVPEVHYAPNFSGEKIYAELMNALQDSEDKGIPIPAKFLPLIEPKKQTGKD